MAPQESPVATPSGPVCVLRKDGSRFVRVVAPLFGFRADDIAVRPADDKLLIVKLNHVAGAAAAAADDTTTAAWTLLETITLPESVDPFTVSAALDKCGRLVVEAPLTQESKDDEDESQQEYSS